MYLSDAKKHGTLVVKTVSKDRTKTVHEVLRFTKGDALYYRLIHSLEVPGLAEAVVADEVIIQPRSGVDTSCGLDRPKVEFAEYSLEDSFFANVWFRRSVPIVGSDIVEIVEVVFESLIIRDLAWCEIEEARKLVECDMEYTDAESCDCEYHSRLRGRLCD